MKTEYWLKLMIFCSSLFALGLGSKNYDASKPSLGQCQANISLSFPWLCHERISIHRASVAELALIDGVSLKRARAIRKFLEDRPLVVIDSLVDIKGIGSKTVIKLSEYFF